MKPEQRAQAMIEQTFRDYDPEEDDLDALNMIRIMLESQQGNEVFLAAVQMLLTRAQSGVGRLW